ncbi:hypothetical protein DLREEDagrD3_04130 [Denitratisoma sp. agr-D3]
MCYFRQIVSVESGTLSYLLADMDRRQAVLIDPAEAQVAVYLSLLNEIQAQLVRILLTHCHDGQTPGIERLMARTGASLCGNQPPSPGQNCIRLAHGDLIACGDELIRARLTPGHTAGCVSYLWRDRIFTGDTLLIDDCGDTDGADSDAGTLFDSLTRQLLTLPDETLVYPARSESGRMVSCIGEQRSRNPYLAGVTRDEFIAAQGQRKPNHSHRVFVEKQS